MHVSGASFLSFMALLRASLTLMPLLVGTNVCPWSPRCARTIVRTGDLGGRWLTTAAPAVDEREDEDWS